MPLSSHLAPLVGTWRGEGQGTLPGMPAFVFDEEIRFEDLGSDLAYSQRALGPREWAGSPRRGRDLARHGR